MHRKADPDLNYIHNEDSRCLEVVVLDKNQEMLQTSANNNLLYLLHELLLIHYLLAECREVKDRM